MSSVISSPISPVQERDIRSATQPFKRAKDHSIKWANGERNPPGQRGTYDDGVASKWSKDDISGSDNIKDKTRPVPRPSDKWNNTHKHTANINPKPNFTSHGQVWEPRNPYNRLIRKADAVMDSRDPPTLYKSLFDLLPEHHNNSDSPVAVAGDEDILYSFESKGPSPTARGRQVDLGGLVEAAEMKWANEQVERIVRGEYEVLDHNGEAVKSGKKGKKGSRSPKNRAVETVVVDEDDGFELI